MAHKIYRALAAPEQINALTKSVAEFLQHWIHDQELIYDLRLVLHEACTNVLLHSYGRDAGEELEVHIHIDPRKRIRLEVRDSGPPFQGPEQAIRSSAPQDESGRGLFIISRLVDSFAYQYAQGQNTLSMERVIEERAWKG